MIVCWKCGNALEDILTPLPFRATCADCTSWLHCCVNCKHYAPGKPNDCNVPGTDPIRDREGCNFCEEFTLLGLHKGKKPANLDDISKQLFKDD